MPPHVSSTCAHHQEFKIALHSLSYHHTDRCDDTRSWVIQFWTPDDEHMCSKHVEAWNKLIVKQSFCASSCLIIEINILRSTVSKTSKLHDYFCFIFINRIHAVITGTGTGIGTGETYISSLHKVGLALFSVVLFRCSSVDLLDTVLS